MSTIYSEIPKFKKLEASMRKSVSSFNIVLSDIQRALNGPRTDKEIKLLKDLYDKTECAQQETKKIIHELYLGLE